jgi:hypothetical protein
MIWTNILLIELDQARTRLLTTIDPLFISNRNNLSWWTNIHSSYSRYLYESKSDLTYFISNFVSFSSIFSFDWWCTADTTEMSIAAENLPLPRRDGVFKKKVPRWFSKQCFEFDCYDCIRLEILLVVYQIHSISDCFICKHWNSIKFMQFFNVLEKNVAAAAMDISKTQFGIIGLPINYLRSLIKSKHVN